MTRQALALNSAAVADNPWGTGSRSRPPPPYLRIAITDHHGHELTALDCGRPFRLPTGGGLTLTGRFPTVASSSQRGLSGTVEVGSEKEVVRGVVTPSADVFLVRDGRIATLPLPQDLVGMRLELPPGRIEILPAEATLSPCDPGGDAADASLLPGTYELYVRVVLNHDDGTSRESIGGPWPLEVR